MLDADEVDSYTLTNFFPRSTGLPMTIWAEVDVVGGRAPRLLLSEPAVGHDWPDWLLVWKLEPGSPPPPGLAPADADPVGRWIGMNRDALLAHWTGRFDSANLAEAVRRR